MAGKEYILKEKVSFQKLVDRIFNTSLLLADLDYQNHRGASETYSKLGETLLGEEMYHKMYDEFIKLRGKKGKGA